MAAVVLGIAICATAAPQGRHVDEDRRELVARARPVLAGSRVVAALDVGWVGAATEAEIVDLAGLTDPSIAALPGGHTSKSVDLPMLLEREVDLRNLGRAAPSGPLSGVSLTKPNPNARIYLRVTDNEGKTATTTLPITVTGEGISNYGDTVMATPGLVDFWRMGETAGPTIADSKGAAPGSITGATFGVPGAISDDPSTALRFNGTSR